MTMIQGQFNRFIICFKRHSCYDCTLNILHCKVIAWANISRFQTFDHTVLVQGGDTANYDPEKKIPILFSSTLVLGQMTKDQGHHNTSSGHKQPKWKVWKSKSEIWLNIKISKYFTSDLHEITLNHDASSDHKQSLRQIRRN